MCVIVVCQRVDGTGAMSWACFESKNWVMQIFQSWYRCTIFLTCFTEFLTTYWSNQVGLQGFKETSEDKTQLNSGGDGIGTVQGLQQSKDLKKITTTGVVQVSTFNKETGFKSSQSTTTATLTVGSSRSDLVTNTRQQGGNSMSQVHVAQNVKEVLDYEEDDFAKDTGLEPLSKDTSQQELIRRAFAGDDVEADFQDMKARAMDEEVVKVEEPKSLPGWGQWTHVQKKRVQPEWQADLAKKKREEALKSRKDAKLQYVIVSERLDKKVWRCFFWCLVRVCKVCCSWCREFMKYLSSSLYFISCVMVLMISRFTV